MKLSAQHVGGEADPLDSIQVPFCRLRYVPKVHVLVGTAVPAAQ